MQTEKVNLKKRSYSIVIGRNIMGCLSAYLLKLKIGCDAYVITNATIKNKYGLTLLKALKKSGANIRFKTVPDTEKSKSLDTAAGILKDIASYDKIRKIFIIAFGGGVIGDLAGFVASIYKRGIPYIQIPTTLLAQVDSGIGGKTAVDLSEAKNLVGAFYQPRLVFSDVKFLETLSSRQIRNGFSEIIKYGIIKDKQLFLYLEKNYKSILNLKAQSIEHVVKCCSRIKAGIVGQDELEEKGIRTILNFGHTVGHALEAASGYKGYGHGEAVALGMLVASDISQALNFTSPSDCLRIENLIRRAGLPTKIQRVPLDKIINAHYRDKKFIGRKNRFVLIKGIGKTCIVENIPLEVIKTAIRKRFQ